MNKVLVISGHIGHKPEYVLRARKNHIEYCSKHGYEYQFLDELPAINELVDKSTAAMYWAKVFWVQTSLSQNTWDWIFWIDSDSIFFDLETSLSDLMHAADFVFSGDSYDLFNAGHFLVKNSVFGNLFLEVWLSHAGTISTERFTSHITDNGILLEQPIATILLAEGLRLPVDLRMKFNRVNGYTKNTGRRHKFFHLIYAPTSKWRLILSRRLLHSSIRKRVMIVEQDRLNAYPFNMPGKKSNLDNAKIVHFPGESKSLFREILPSEN